MHMITGDTRDKKLIAKLQSLGWGRMVIGTRIIPYPGEKWGFDNGAYKDWTSGREFDEDAFKNRLEMAYKIGVPYMAVVPDIVTEGEKSLEFSLKWLERLPLNWPWYLAVQDGMRIEQVEKVLCGFAGIFLGGSNRFKATALYWRQLAHKHRKKFHYARVGTPRKVQLAKEVGADSCDSAFPLWAAERFDEFARWFNGPVVPTLWGPESWALHPDEVA